MILRGNSIPIKNPKMVIAQGPKRNIGVVWGPKLEIINLSGPKTPIVVAHSPKHVNDFT